MRSKREIYVPLSPYFYVVQAYTLLVIYFFAILWFFPFDTDCISLAFRYGYVVPHVSFVSHSPGCTGTIRTALWIIFICFSSVLIPKNTNTGFVNVILIFTVSRMISSHDLSLSLFHIPTSVSWANQFTGVFLFQFLVHSMDNPDLIFPPYVISKWIFKS